MADVVTDSLLAATAVAESDRQLKIAEAWLAYYGDNALPLEIGADEMDDNIRLNYGKLIVNKGVSWLFGADRGLNFSVPLDENRNDAAAEAKLQELWPQTERAVALHQMGVNGAVCGHNFVRLRLPDEFSESPRVIVLDPSNMVVLWNQEDLSDVIEYRYSWNAIDLNTGDPYVRRQRTIKENGAWRILDEKSVGDGATFELLGEEAWPYLWSPVFDNQNLPAPNEFYGAADLENDVLELVSAIEFVGGYARKLVRHRGHPLPWVTGETAERMSQINVALGRLLVIPDPSAQIGQLESADLGTTMALYETLKTALYEIARVPATAFGTTMSNIAEETVELSFAPAVEKTWDKRLTYGPMLSALTSALLEVGGSADRRPVPNWTPVVPRSAKSEADALERDLRMGIVSKATASNKRGYDWEVESAQISEDSRVAASKMADAFNSGAIDMNA